MRHKIISAIFALGFLVLIQMTNSVFRFFVSSIVAYTIILLAYNFWYLRSTHLFTFWSWIKISFLVAGSVCLYAVLPSSFLKGAFLIFTIFVLFFLEMNIHLISEQLNFFLTLISYFGMCIGIAGFNFYYLQRNAFALVILGIVTFLVSRASFDYIPQPSEKKNYFAALLTLAVLEIAWSLGFLPFHFSVFALIIFNVFYFLWIIVYYYLFNNLSPKKTAFHLVFSSFIIIVAFISTPWK